MTPSATIGLFGGTFNPIHVAHLRAAEDVAEALELDRVVLVPSATPPHKAPRRDDPMAPAPMRLSWARRAVAGNPRLDVDDLEVARGGPSYTVDTLRHYAARLAPAKPVFLIGQDALVELDTWKEPREILSLAHFAVMTRPPLPPRPLRALLPAGLSESWSFGSDERHATHRTAGTWMRLLPVTALDVSATDLRARLRSGRSVRYLIPDGVREEILRSGIYSERKPA